MFCLQKTRKIFCFIAVVCFFCRVSSVWAFETEINTKAEEIDFGRAVLLASTASVSISYNGNPLWLRAAKSSQGRDPVAGRITFSIVPSEWPAAYASLFIKPDVTSTTSFELGGQGKCTVELTNMSFSSPQITLTQSQNEAALYVGATIKVKGFCDSDYEYAGSVTIPYSVKDSMGNELKTGDVVLPIAFQSEYNNELTKDNDMSFGDVLSSSEAGSVTLSPEGVITDYSGGVKKVRGVISAGEVSIYGAYGQEITNVSVDDMIYLYNGEDTMKVGEFTLSPGKSFSLNMEKNNQGYNQLKIGGTLHINENQPVGNYTGVVNIIISY